MWMLALSTALAGTCDADSLAQGVDALKVVDDDAVVMLSAAAVVEGCKLGEGLDSALDLVARGSSDQHALADTQAVAESAAIWLAACPGGIDAAASAARMASAEQRAHLWTACRLADRGWFTESEWAEAHGLVFLPILVPEAFERSAVSPEVARVYARGLIGLANRYKPVVVREFVPLIP